MLARSPANTRRKEGGRSSGSRSRMEGCLFPRSLSPNRPIASSFRRHGTSREKALKKVDSSQKPYAFSAAARREQSEKFATNIAENSLTPVGGIGFRTKSNRLRENSLTRLATSEYRSRVSLAEGKTAMRLYVILNGRQTGGQMGYQSVSPSVRHSVSQSRQTVERASKQLDTARW